MFKDIRDVFGLLIFFAVMLVMMSMSGCAALVPVQAQRAAADGVNKYCTSFTYEQRATVFRPEFAKLIAPNRAKIECCGDPENPKPCAGETPAQ